MLAQLKGRYTAHYEVSCHEKQVNRWIYHHLICSHDQCKSRRIGDARDAALQVLASWAEFQHSFAPFVHALLRCILPGQSRVYLAGLARFSSHVPSHSSKLKQSCMVTEAVGCLCRRDILVTVCIWANVQKQKQGCTWEHKGKMETPLSFSVLKSVVSRSSPILSQSLCKADCAWFWMKCGCQWRWYELVCTFIF